MRESGAVPALAVHPRKDLLGGPGQVCTGLCLLGSVFSPAEMDHKLREWSPSGHQESRLSPTAALSWPREVTQDPGSGHTTR